MINNLRNKFYDLERSPYVTYSLLAITGIMYLLISVNGGSQNISTLIRFGAKVNELIYLGDWWRLITPMFLHIGFTHFLFNGLVIYFLGIQLEKLIGHFRFFILYVLSGILGNAASFAINSSISAGASTAIFGMFASTIVLAKMYPYHTAIQHLSRSYLILIVINVVLGIFSSSVDNAGHLGGLLGGYLIMYALSSKNAMNNPEKQRVLSGLAYIGILILLGVIGYLRVNQSSFGQLLF